jgi:hypothetical protein
VEQARKHLPWYIAAGCGVAVVTSFWGAPPPDDHMGITEPRVLRILSESRFERLPVFQTAVNGTITHLDVVPPKPAPIPTMRVDFKVDGQPVTLWVWDSPMPADH